MTTPITVILRDNTSRERIEALAGKSGWREIGDVVRGHFVLAGKRWYEADGTMIEYLEDHTSDVRYVTIAGTSQDHVAAALRADMPSFGEEELLTEIEESEDAIVWVRGLSRLSVLRPDKTDDRYLALWKRGLEHKERAARRAAIRTAYGCAWPELTQLVRDRVKHEAELLQPLEHLLSYLEREE